ncbi:MAG: thymidylate synthase [Lactobacillales bacterium]|jgi:thymidylate synthase|nr:thymidylate synthase [Lactobacillales bacterium]
MTKADDIFKRNIKSILEEGVWSENARPKYKSGETANSKYITGSFAKYDLAQKELPITTLRPIAIKTAIKELLWIYQDQSSNIDFLEEKYNVKYWRNWVIDDGKSIGQRYGATVRKYDIVNKLLKGLKENPWNRRNIINLWQYQDFEESKGLLPCAFQSMYDVRRVGEDIYLDATLIQRSNDMLVAHHINAMQYVALALMIAKHCSFKVGKFFYFVNNLHIYDNQFAQAKELLRRTPSEKKPILYLDAPEGTDFFDIRAKNFKLTDYEPVKPQLSFELAI